MTGTGDVDALQALLDRSFTHSSEHLRSIMEPQRRLTAERLLRELPCPAVLNIATVTARGEPRISAVDGHFLDGHWRFGTAGESPKARQLLARPAISASYTPRDGYGVFCHGRAVPLEGAERDAVVAHFGEVYGTGPDAWAGAAWFRIDADWLVGFAMTDEEMARIEADRASRAAAAES
ncbi:MAG: pyridoxamine 5'-phosphate oxidase family protein [Jatrophihabitans sp.]|uniref:pyridoxamine 5'-phosphate oxidase family protein n=1 Tax=Jatrophihabitans sp. TaxID=1932789 RepID=UPI003F7EC883